MGTNASQSGTETASTVDRVAAHLASAVAERDGPLYVKSRFLAGEMDLSSREIGAAICRIDPMEHGLAVEAWSYSGGTTWRVTAAD